MRIRNAALAGATALAVAFGGSTVAFAAETTEQGDNTVTVEKQSQSKKSQSKTGPGGVADTTPEDYTPSLSSKIGNIEGLESDQAADGTAIFGIKKDGFSEQPEWAKVLYGVTVAAGVSALLGTIIGPVYNFFVHGPSF
ncbi:MULTISPECIES: hypothetical protein [unclassified Corynebacterium]|uniref:hypothetical protein n=1 Tax=unclassified Corynebacterium TaxID=2624378 RepID=UPI0008A16948|nr:MULTISPECIES: hypothetical protein [unclassified Corynebacterium]MDK8898356.1 hypothetical protein [Corynebacterium sp. MSK004]OFP87505.1 hypothetical protein HMPREF2967_09280 [Corynebacterium sp. HMSC059E07]